MAIIRGTELILTAFPKMEQQMINLLKDRFIEKGFSNEKMFAAIYHVIDTFSGWSQLPCIGDFIAYDKTIKTFSHFELTIKHKDAFYFGATYDPIAKEYDQIDDRGQMRYARKEDVEQYSLKKWMPKLKP